VVKFDIIRQLVPEKTPVRRKDLGDMSYLDRVIADFSQISGGEGAVALEFV